MTNYVEADPNRPLIIDISKWQNDPVTPEYVDFAKMKERGVDGIIMKAGQGLYADRDFVTNWNLCKIHGIPVGSYWYYDNRVEPSRQAKVWADTLDVENGELWMWLDLEDRQAGVYAGWKNWYVMLAKLQELLPNAKIGIYTGHFYWTEFTIEKGIPISSLYWFRQFPLWLSWYGREPTKKTLPWDDWTIWQFTDFLDGESYGAESRELDGNYFNGSIEEYKSYFGLSGVTNPPEDTVSVLRGTLQIYSNGDTKWNTNAL